MKHLTTPIQPGDIVVIVPRWIIGAVGLLMLLMGLSVSFVLLFASLIIESILFTLIILVIVPINLLILYVTWRFYWYFLLAGLMLQSLCYCATVVGLTGLMRSLPPGVMSTPLGPIVAVLARTHPLNVFMAVLLAAFAVGVIIMFYRMIMGPVQQPIMTSSYGDPYDIDEPPPPPRRKRSGSRDLWRDD